jgi:Protein of unknown function (DUF2865)
VTTCFVTALRRAVGIVPAALFLLTLCAPPASSQDMFDTVLGAFKRPAPIEIPPSVKSYAEPLTLTAPTFSSKPSGDPAGPYVAYCVRLCDGRFFPLQRSASISPADQCRSLCPAAKTKVLSGSSINNATTTDGTRYINLSNAFLFRTRMVDGCTCNGRDAFGVARIDIAADPTLRAGDIVATNTGFAAYTGVKTKNSSGLKPIEKYSGIPNETRQKLSLTRVTPVQSTARTPATIAASEKSENPQRADRRAQLFK